MLMRRAWAWVLGFVLCTTLPFGMTATVERIMVKNRRDEAETVVDHQISLEEAKKVVQQIDEKTLGQSSAVGCASCSLEERLYCESAALLSDHCCCDTKLREPLMFAPHICYLSLPPAEPCTPMVQNCAEYARIMDCCCKHVLAHQSAPGPASWLPYMILELFRVWRQRSDYNNHNYNNTPHRPVAVQHDFEQGHEALASGFAKYLGDYRLVATSLTLLLLASYRVV